MTDRSEYLSDDEVDYYAHRDDPHFDTTPRKALAREVRDRRERDRQLDALRATCRTCAGQTRYEGDGWTCPDPDCVDGRLTVGATFKRLVDTITELLKGGAHDGPCEGSGFDGCDIHWDTSKARDAQAAALLASLPKETR